MSELSKCVVSTVPDIKEEEPKLTMKEVLEKAFSRCREKYTTKDFVDYIPLNESFDTIEDFTLEEDAFSEKILSRLLSTLISAISKIAKPRAAPITLPPSIIESVTGVRVSPEEAKKALPEIERLPGNRPFSPVTSSNVRGRAVRDKTLFVQFHSYEGVYPYFFESNKDAVEAFEEMTKSSPGRYVWEKLRGKEMGPVFGKPKKQTPGGTTASKVPYSKMGPGGFKAVKTELGAVPEYRKKSEEMKKFKMEVKKPAESAEAFTVKELKEHAQKPSSAKAGKITKDMIERGLIEFSVIDEDSIINDMIDKELIDISYANYIVHDFDTTIPGKWITTRYGARVYIYDDPKQAPKKPEYYTPEELSRYEYAGEEIGIVAVHEVEAWLQVDRRVSMEDIKFGVGVINRVIESLPLNIKKMVNEVRVYNKITDDPSMWEDKGKVPEAYKSIGWKKTYDELSGVYIIGDNNVILTPNAWESTTRHEIGHAVFYGINEKDRNVFTDLWNIDKKDLYENADLLDKQSEIFDKDDWRYDYYKEEAEGLRYEANDVEEYWAESFRRFYEAKRPIYPWQGVRYQKQLSSEVAKFFREKMRKYEKD